MIACVLHGVEIDTLRGEKYTGTGLDLMAATLALTATPALTL